MRYQTETGFMYPFIEEHSECVLVDQPWIDEVIAHLGQVGYSRDSSVSIDGTMYLANGVLNPKIIVVTHFGNKAYHLLVPFALTTQQDWQAVAGQLERIAEAVSQEQMH